ncbi:MULTISPECIES: TPM domain-containing protein [unclassified Mucilaginibacter]|uniref:TPM domain-containing protein n=1 Tax=unclassified Mucilaginibacter TaxID=2617802 RepID=UPI002AC8C00B|nr:MULTISPECIES: TPM domain-containing protein [unclassified Mucilaginibacter]MEB0262142.1 TPM domain-containing protein [Mucilaginibacter sp. 10I4]MEB0279803.1 TPM domain-containing protein [Mucilaginibacter sp. 10B2]MEB0301245.1 TPM domain-containing protein [Mucilaginibacter sp. 5C4]WPX24225.1 TPM domain-containing protein [Mucilaginibacter sp. 5C4]
MAVFTEEEQQRIQQAVADAEKNTSGEVRVCMEKTCSDDPLDRAAKYFAQLEMHKTKLRNGVLIYVATVDRKFAIIGDAGINSVVPGDFWDTTKESMLNHFKYGNLVEGIITGIKEAGEHLQKYFPHLLNDKNQLPDDIAFMDGN